MNKWFQTIWERIQFGFEPAQEVEYQHFLLQRSMVSLRGAILFSIFLFLGFAWLDVYVAPDDYWSMWVFRLIYCGYALLILAYSFTVFFESLHQLVMASLIVVGAICLLGIMIIPIDNNVRNIYYTAFILLVFFNFTLTNLRFRYAVSIALITFCLYVLTCLFYLGMLKEGWFSSEGTLFINNIFFLSMSILMGAVICVIIETYRRNDFLRGLALKKEQEISSNLLLNILPNSIANRLKQSSETIADEHEQVSILFSDLVGFTELSSQKSPKDVVEMLDTIVSKFDWLSDKFGLEKIKTIGDAYMVAGGIGVKQTDHAIAMADMALSMQRELEKYNRRFGSDLDLRIGIHIGPVVAGVIGSNKFSYDLWGDTVNVASRMESTAQNGEIQVSQEMYHAIKNHFTLIPHGKVKMKGKGELFTYYLKA